MEWFRWQRNPWGQEVLIGLSWDLIWVAIAAGLLLAVIHAVLYTWRWRPGNFASGGAQGCPSESGVAPGQLPERITRHSLASRIFHWVMAASVLTLLFTAFLPILGLKFSWVTPHWMAGIVLSMAVLFHIVHATFWKGLGLMWVDRHDLLNGWFTLRQVVVGSSSPAAGKPGKNPLENKLFHHVTALATLAVIATGLLMMVRIDSPFWTRNPYLMADHAWGLVYVIHGAASVALITLIMVHLYFAARPEKRWITLSMVLGWIPRSRYLDHFDPRRWPVAQQKPRGGSDSLPRSGLRGMG